MNEKWGSQINVSFMSYSTRVELRNSRRTLFTIFWLGISYRGNPNRKQPILAPKSQQVIFTMICYQNSNAVCSKVNKVRWHFLSSTGAEYDMKDTYVLWLASNIEMSNRYSFLCPSCHIWRVEVRNCCRTLFTFEHTALLYW